MKRPVTLSANLVQSLGTSMALEEKIHLLDEVLVSLYSIKESGKIRRNPETRLVIHALCLSDKNQKKPLLMNALKCLYEILENPNASDMTLCSTLNCLEVLFSDNALHDFTLPYSRKTIEICIRLFNRNSWVVRLVENADNQKVMLFFRNADLQLLKALIERFLGVSLAETIRPKTIEDLFQLFPILSDTFLELLSQKELNDSCMVVFLFFAESQIRTNFCNENFLQVFANIIKNYSNHLGHLAIKAYTALCPVSKIPTIISEICTHIKCNFHQINKNSFANFVKLLRELDQKYACMVTNSNELICQSFKALSIFLQNYDCFYFDLLYLRLFPLEKVCQRILSLLDSEIDFKKRIWLNNHISFVLTELGSDALPNFLNQILKFNLPDFLQIRILSNVVDRVQNNANDLVKIFIAKLSKLSDDNKLLITAYSKCILLFAPTATYLSDDLIGMIREDYHCDNIYKMFIYIFALAHASNVSNEDRNFINRSIEVFITAIDNEEVACDLSATVTYLYRVTTIKQRYNVIKLVFYLLLNESTSFDMIQFVTRLFNSDSSSILISFINLLDLRHLKQILGCECLARKLLKELLTYLQQLSEDIPESETFYVAQHEFSISKRIVEAIIIKILYDSA